MIGDRFDTYSQPDSRLLVLQMCINMAVTSEHINAFKAINRTMFILAVCGRRLFPESRIVGGARSSFGKWPWQVKKKKK